MLENMVELSEVRQFIPVIIFPSKVINRDHLVVKYLNSYNYGGSVYVAVSLAAFCTGYTKFNSRSHHKRYLFAFLTLIALKSRFRNS